MYKRGKISIGVTVAFVALLVAGWGQAEMAPTEVISKVNEGVTFLEKAGPSGLSEFNDPNGRWVWNGNYLVIQDCEGGKVAAHPLKQKVVGMPLDKMVDIKGNAFGFNACEAANAPKGGWCEYWFPKPGEKEPSRKLSYNRKVKGTGLIVIGGIYDDNKTVEELNKLIP